jgi:hypothetical protein
VDDGSTDGFRIWNTVLAGVDRTLTKGYNEMKLLEDVYFWLLCQLYEILRYLKGDD